MIDADTGKIGQLYWIEKKKHICSWNGAADCCKVPYFLPYWSIQTISELFSFAVSNVENCVITRSDKVLHQANRLAVYHRFAHQSYKWYKCIRTQKEIIEVGYPEKKFKKYSNEYVTQFLFWADTQFAIRTTYKNSLWFWCSTIEYLKQPSTAQRLRWYRKWGALNWTSSLQMVKLEYMPF